MITDSLFVRESLIRIFSDGAIIINPPKKIAIQKYICSKKFELDHLMQMYEEQHNHGYVLVEGEECYIYLLEKSGSHYQFKLLDKTQTKQQKKQKKGGQSAPRIGRIRVEMRNNYINKVREMMVNAYTKDNKTKLIIEKLVIGGPSITKNELIDNHLFTQYFGKIPLKIIDTKEINDTTIHEMYEMSQEFLANEKERELYQEIELIQDYMQNNPDRLYFGKEVEENIDMIEKVVMLDTLNYEINKTCIRMPQHIINKIGIDIIGIRYY